MAVEAENICIESMGFGLYAAQDCFMGSVLGIEDGFCFPEFDDQQRREQLHPFVDSYDNLAAAAAAAAAASSSISSCFGSLPVEIFQSLSCDFETQRVEMDWFLQLENKRLRRSILQEETRRQAVIMQKYESRIKYLMLQKEEELAMARNKTRELQQFLKRTEMEARAWEKAAKEKEAIVTDLSNRLNQVKENETLFRNHAQVDDDDGAVSFCDSSSKGQRNHEEDEEPKYNSKKMACKLCRFRSSCVVLFPCRHLCCCKPCETLLEHCPVCQTVKEATLEAFLA